MSDREELELEALRRQLDDAFETTRPRAGFEDELWTRMQQRRPAATRLSDAWFGFIRTIREAPVPSAAVAALLVVLIGAGALVYAGFGRGGASTASSTAGQYAPQSQSVAGAGTFGRLPSPVLITAGQSPAGAGPNYSQAQGALYSGPVNLKWTGKLDVSLAVAPVFRYHEPSISDVDQFANSLGAALQDRPAGYLGSYQTIDLSLRVSGTVQSPAREPSYIILPTSSIPPVESVGGEADAALVFLAQHNLRPGWPYQPSVAVAGDQSTVSLFRQFAVSGYGYAYLVDPGGARYGIEVDLKGNRPTLVSGPLPLSQDSATYQIISSQDAIQSALASSPGAGASAPTVLLSSAELVYTLVVAGDHSFYEPSFLFSGSFTLNGKPYVKRILVPAVVPAQRTP